MATLLKKIFLCAMLLPIMFSFTLTAQIENFTIYFKDGAIITNATEARSIGNSLVYKLDKKNRSSFLHKISKVVDNNGNIYYEQSNNTYTKKWDASNDEYIYLFKRDNNIIATGRWDENDCFAINGTAPDGIYSEYYDSGVLQSTLSVSSNTLNGTCKFYYETGILKREGIFVGGKETGTSKLYNSIGTLEGTSEYKDGKKNGITKLFYKSGTIKAILQYNDGNIDGIQKTFYESGQKQAVVRFDKGIRNGPTEEFYENGKTMMKGNFINDNLDGQVVQYYESGRVKSSKTFDNGKLIK